MRPLGTTIIAALALAGCDEDPPIYPDFCATSGRAFSDTEKIAATLGYIHQHIDDPKMENYRNRKVGRFVRKYPDSAEFIKAYTSALPDCCEVYRPPSYVEWYATQSDLFAEYDLIGAPGDWVADVAIEKKSLNPGAKHLLRPDFKVSDCNRVSQIDRG